MNDLKSFIRNIPNFPEKGVQFKDLTPILLNPQLLSECRDVLVDYYKDRGITKVLGLESRGFILAPAIAMGIGAGFVPVRKPGKLPYTTIGVDYQKEYGKDRIEMHVDAIAKDDVVLIHDDILATGGTIEATIKLLQLTGAKKIYVNFFAEITALNGRERIPQGIDVMSLVQL